MKRKLILFISLLTILFPFSINAEEDMYEYKNINISAVFITQADVSGISKIKVYYTTYSNGKPSNAEVVLLKDNNFTTTVSVGSINDASFNYGICETYDGKKDIYGFLPITGTRSFDAETNSIRLSLKVDFNYMNYDGVKYRQNSDVTENELKERINGVPSSNVINSPADIVTTTTPVESNVDEDGNVVIGTTKPTIIQDTKEETPEKNVNNNKEDNHLGLLFLILGILGLIVLIFVVYTLIKMYQANKRV